MFKLLVTVLALLHYGRCDLECYDCTTAPGPNQDHHCAQDGYSGHTQSYSSWKSCLTETHVTGSVRRYGSTIAMEDGECMGLGNSMTCYCLDSLCNNDLCQHCGVDFTTPPPPASTTTPGATYTTAIGTTDMTDVTDFTTDETASTGLTDFSTASPETDFTTDETASTGLTDFSTASPETDLTTDETAPTGLTDFSTDSPETDFTTDETASTGLTDFSTAAPEITTTMKTTTEPGEGLRCYVCIDCPEVDENTDIVQNEHYKSCVTTIALSGNFIIRGGDYKAHPDGECVHEDGGMVCFCRGDLCNDGYYGGLYWL